MTSTKHIVFIVPGFAKDEDDFLCVPPLQQLVLELKKSESIQISILAIHYPYVAKKYSWNGINVVSLGGNNAKNWRKLKFYRKAITFLNQLNRRHKIDIVHSFWLSDASVIGSKWSKRNGKPHFITFMGQEAERAKKYVRFLAKNDELVALSNEQRERIERQLGVAVNHVVPFGIKNEVSQEFNTNRSTDILGVGSLIEVKNYVQFVDTVAELQNETSLNVKLIGDGPQRSELERYAKEKNAQIQFMGIIDRKSVLIEMSNAKVLFHPSKSESLGYVFLEALMCGMMIVSRNVGIAGDVTSNNWSVVENGDYTAAIKQQLSREEFPKPELPLTVSETSRHYLSLWKIEQFNSLIFEEKKVKEKSVNQHLVKVFFQNRFKILIITLLFVVAAGVMTSFIPKKYVAFGVVYPTGSNSIKDIAENPDFGFEVQADRLIQLFESEKMRTSIIKKFNLIDYYELDTNSAGWHYALSKSYSEDINFSRTRYLSVAIEAKMKDPYLAANIVTALMDNIDSLRADLFRKNLIRLSEEYQHKIPIQEAVVDSLLQEIQFLEEKPGARILAERRLKQLSEDENNGIFMDGNSVIKEKLTKHPGFKLEKKIDEYYRELGILNDLKNEQRTTLDAIELPFPNVYKISEAEVDRKRVSPSLSRNLLVGGLFGLLFSLTFFIVSAQWKSLKKRIQ